MKTQIEIEDRISELEAIGSPSALSKVSELKLVLGIEDTADSEADMLTDLLLGSVSGQENMWDQLPDFVQGHVTYAFDENYEIVKRLRKIIDTRAWTEEEDEEMRKAQDILREKTTEYRKALREKKKAVMSKTNNETEVTELEEEEDELYEGDYIKIPDKEADISKATLISSQAKSGKHRPLLDLDLKAAVIPSSTSGHGHLYIDKELTWKQYQKLLNVLADLGIIEAGYRGASLARGYTALRLPWVKKTAEEMKESEEKRAKN